MHKIPYYSFVRLAREAEAHYCLRKNAIVDVDVIEKYLAEHPDVADRVQSVREVWILSLWSSSRVSAISWQSMQILLVFLIRRMNGWISSGHFPSIRCFRRLSSFGA